MSTEGSGTTTRFWRTQLPVDYIDTSLTINNFENVSANLSGGSPARLWYIRFEQTNNGATDEDIELEITINGTAYTWTQTAVSGQPYHANIGWELTAADFSTGQNTAIVTVGSAIGDADQAIPFTARTVGLVRVRQTTDVDGTSAQIEVNIIWDKLVGL